MNRRELSVFLIIELFAIVWAAALFSILPSKPLAGGLAGGYFVVSGLFMLSRGRRWANRWRSLTWYGLFVHVFGVSLPLLISRYLQRQVDFNDVQIMGFSGPEFHRISSTVFASLILATALDWVRAGRPIPK